MAKKTMTKGQKAAATRAANKEKAARAAKQAARGSYSH